MARKKKRREDIVIRIPNAAGKSDERDDNIKEPTDVEVKCSPRLPIKNIVKIAIIIILLVNLVSMVINSMRNVTTLTYDEVISAVKNKAVKEIDIEPSRNDVFLKMADGTKAEAKVPSVESFNEFVQNEIECGNEAKVKVVESSNIVSNLLSILLALLPVFWIVLLMRMLGNSSSSLGKTFEDILGGDYTVKPVSSNTTFDDVAGLTEEREQFMEIVEYLKNPEKYDEMGARPPKGIIVNGAPGTGKTLLAKAIAGEAGVPFFQESGSNFDDKFVGVGANRVRQLFKEAKKVAPCLIFIDEIDSIAQNRYSGRSYSEQTLNQLLAEMDGFSTSDNIIVIAATNHIEVLDPAILRRGRFDRHIFIPMPDMLAREEILKVHARNKKFSDDVSMSEIAKRTVGFSGADLECVLNEAAIYAVNQDKSCISMPDIDEAIARVIVGLEKKTKKVTEEDKQLTAIHEAGHAIVSAVERPEISNLGISIVPRGRAGGYNMFDVSDRTFWRKKDIEKELKVCYGGRAAEEVILNDISSGASGDLESASKLVQEMITRYAMSGSLMVKVSGEAEYNQKIDTSMMEQAEEICKKAYNETVEIIKKYKDVLLMLAGILYEKEYLSPEDVEAFFKENLKF